MASSVQGSCDDPGATSAFVVSLPFAEDQNGSGAGAWRDKRRFVLVTWSLGADSMGTRLALCLKACVAGSDFLVCIFSINLTLNAPITGF